MMFSRVFALTVFQMGLVIAALGAEAFDFDVARWRPLRDEPGTLHIDARAITFHSRDGKTSLTIPLRELREANVADARALRFGMYEVNKWKRREYTFRASHDAPVEELAQFLAGRILRPVIGHYADGARFKAAAYHRRVPGGTSGVLEIDAGSIRFVSDKPMDSRTWLYADIETIGSPDAFRFRVTTTRETYVLDLKEKLSKEAYDFAWDQVYHLDRSGK